jgi:hypothetical protein
MPTKRSRRSRGSVQALNETQKMQLLYGIALTGFEDEAFQTRTEARRAWKKHKEDLIQEFIEQEGNGRRPAAFYKFDTEKEPDVIGQSYHYGPDRKVYTCDIRECEFDFLRREGFLLKDEKPGKDYLKEKFAKLAQIEEYERFKRGNVIQFQQKVDEKRKKDEKK